MTKAVAPVYEIPDEGQHVAVLVDEIDLGMIANTFEPSKPERHMDRLVFATDQIGKDGKPLYVTDDVNLITSPKGTLFKYIKAFIHPAQITPDTSWDTADYIGCCIGLNILHNVKPSGTWANIDSVFMLPKAAKRLSIPAGYVRKSGQRNTTFAGPDQSNPPATAAPVTAAARAAAAWITLAERKPSTTGQEEPPTPLA
jgi:hypothetical protein